MELIENSKGWIYSDREIEVFFGKKTFSERCTATNKDLPLNFLKQIHGDKIILQNITNSSEEHPKEGDAHFSAFANIALAIKTADCMPLMIFAKSKTSESSHVLAIHAGWRGVAQRLIPKGLSKLIELGYVADEIKIWVGPHIMLKSFEVKSDAIALLNSAGDAAGCITQLGDKTFFDLTELAQRQIQEFKIPKTHLHVLKIDSFERLDLHSYRRDKDKAGRLISYIFKRV